MEAGRYPNLQGESASWRLRRADGAVPAQASRLKTQELLMLQFKSKSKEKMVSQFKVMLRRKNGLLLRVSLSVLFEPPSDRMQPPTFGSVFCFIQSTDSNANLTRKHPHRHNYYSDQISGLLMVQSRWHMKGTITTLQMPGWWRGKDSQLPGDTRIYEEQITRDLSSPVKEAAGS